ncbi:hypothetical protein D9611_011265 [Ephemerocybe angulata]|uniref:DUF1996 domain-containing protein n=1 Tax=Ephemerocybe angulata TaxID=980116 RepID=A0A8H5BCF9_9AGAR|nr:hypothetical protein D9611_011265 [Tulosesus angulatus]
MLWVVPQIANHNRAGPGYQNGGMTVYYFQPRAPTKNLDIVAFRKGFRMIVGHPNKRSDDIDPNLTEAKAVSFRCFVSTTDLNFKYAGMGSTSTPKVTPSHVAHPLGPKTDGLQFFGTDCPDTHPVRLPLLFFEIVWDTRPFNNPALSLFGPQTEASHSS